MRQRHPQFEFLYVCGYENGEPVWASILDQPSEGTGLARTGSGLDSDIRESAHSDHT
jgi:hypothetical protein